jgi:hypothetical protein
MAKIKTERAWLASTTPHSLLLTLKGKRLPRQRRLFAVACCRRWLHEMLDAESRQAVEVAERYADGLASGEELAAAYRAAQEAAARRLNPCLTAPEWKAGPLWNAWRLAHAAQLACASSKMEDAANEIRLRIAHLLGKNRDKQLDQEMLIQCALIRDIFGNPFRPQLTVDRSWLSWNDRTVPNLAQAIYIDRSFDRLPILADALEEAGCDNADILNHCRQHGEHVRGCWVVDLLVVHKQ